ncbi:MAG: hypothetical protein AAF212_03870 [Verrucomicrobiota bacterium]
MKHLILFMFTLVCSANPILPVLHIFQVESDRPIEEEIEIFKPLVDQDIWTKLEFLDSHKVLWYERLILSKGTLIESGLIGSLSLYNGVTMPLDKMVEATWIGGNLPLYSLKLAVWFPEIEWKTIGGKPRPSVSAKIIESDITVQAGKLLTLGGLSQLKDGRTRYFTFIIVVEELKEPSVEMIISEESLVLNGYPDSFDIEVWLKNLPKETRIFLVVDESVGVDRVASAIDLIEGHGFKKHTLGASGQNNPE